MSNIPESHEEAYKEACACIAGGVNSPVRAFRGVGGAPVFVSRASGPFIVDILGNQYIDYVGSWGPMIMGHAHPDVVAAITEFARRGTSFGAPTLHETKIARKITEAIPSVEKIRFVNSGTEATMSAIRLARGYTDRRKILKFEGCYHGHADSLLVRAGSGAATLGIPGSKGVPESFTRETVSAIYNDPASVRSAFDKFGSEIAGVIVEPVAGNMGVIPPEDGFLEGLRHITSEFGALLVFDEVMTGFRVAFGGAQSLYGIDPDLTCLGKIIGGGLPAAAYGGKAEIMDYLAPTGPVYQAGTLSGNPLAMVAGLAALEALSAPGFYEDLESKAAAFSDEIASISKELSFPTTQSRVGSMACLFFTEGPVRNYADAQGSNAKRYAEFFHGLLEEGVYLAPSQFEAMFFSAAHGADELDKTVAAFRSVLKRIA